MEMLSYLWIAVLLLLLVMWCVFRQFIVDYYLSWDNRNITPSDYAIQIDGFPKDTSLFYEHDLKDFLNEIIYKKKYRNKTKQILLKKNKLKKEMFINYTRSSKSIHDERSSFNLNNNDLKSFSESKKISKQNEITDEGSFIQKILYIYVTKNYTNY